MLTCDYCNEKTEVLKGMRLAKIPPVLTIGLSRFDLDYETFQRVKINDKFTYPLELNVADFIDSDSHLPIEECIYELKSIVIHRGSAFGGHYHAFVYTIILS